jgi:hypothetical protein
VIHDYAHYFETTWTEPPPPPEPAQPREATPWDDDARPVAATVDLAAMARGEGGDLRELATDVGRHGGRFRVRHDPPGPWCAGRGPSRSTCGRPTGDGSGSTLTSPAKASTGRPVRRHVHPSDGAIPAPGKQLSGPSGGPHRDAAAAEHSPRPPPSHGPSWRPHSAGPAEHAELLVIECITTAPPALRRLRGSPCTSSSALAPGVPIAVEIHPQPVHR